MPTLPGRGNAITGARPHADLARHPHGVKEWALDPATAKRLWTVSTALLHARQ
ncbi:hypothetical protein [Nonomuraea sp. NPDC050783]|uniref:hypothetical protein n=1 Tax=Nonomuraea sp. NPDC050783 TaxID=3154634 RepID=UPI0034668926